jgi:hypothetical protein
MHLLQTLLGLVLLLTTTTSAPVPENPAFQGNSIGFTSPYSIGVGYPDAFPHHHNVTAKNY